MQVNRLMGAVEIANAEMEDAGGEGLAGICRDGGLCGGVGQGGKESFMVIGLGPE